MKYVRGLFSFLVYIVQFNFFPLPINIAESWVTEKYFFESVSQVVISYTDLGLSFSTDNLAFFNNIQKWLLALLRGSQQYNAPR